MSCTPEWGCARVTIDSLAPLGARAPALRDYCFTGQPQRAPTLTCEVTAGAQRGTGMLSFWFLRQKTQPAGFTSYSTRCRSTRACLHHVTGSFLFVAKGADWRRKRWGALALGVVRKHGAAAGVEDQRMCKPRCRTSDMKAQRFREEGGKIEAVKVILKSSYMHTYKQGEEIGAKVNSLTSIETELPFSYYSLPYCHPEGGIKKSAENLGELLMGDQIDNSPYRFRINVNESLYLCTTNPLDEADVKLLKQRSRDLYQVNMILDNLPVRRFTEQNGMTIQWTGYPVGYIPEGTNDVYIINHLKFKVLVHKYEGGKVKVLGTGEGMEVISETDSDANSGYEIVGFEVVPCSLKRDPKAMLKLKMYDKVDPVNCPVELEKSQLIKEKEQITFTYEVEFVNSDIRWPSRWDAYLKMEGSKIHWFSIMNSLMVILFLAGIVFVIFLRTVRRDLTRYEELDKEAQAQMNEELSGWKLVVGDVFREPTSSKLLCVMIGDGVQILGMAIVTIFFAAFGFMSPASRGMLLTGMIVLYMLLGIVSGYAAVRLWRTLKV
nr:unnamed protein product [Digitaria exilis]